MKKIIHKANSRGLSKYDWLHSQHTFSFGEYYNPDRMSFGVLRVLNDDIVAPSRGFDTHPHKNMEIISIPLSGSLQHQDSAGHMHVILPDEVQLMSAGSGIRHSEYNHSDSKDVNFLQIWILPQTQETMPHYDQKKFSAKDRANQFQLIVSPNTEKDQIIQINQDAYVSLADVEEGVNMTYPLYQKKHGVYVFVITGEIQVAGEKLSARDGIGLTEIDQTEFTTIKTAKVLIIEVPM